VNTPGLRTGGVLFLWLLSEMAQSHATQEKTRERSERPPGLKSFRVFGSMKIR
jgi:hypothetical protein